MKPVRLSFRAIVVSMAAILMVCLQACNPDDPVIEDDIATATPVQRAFFSAWLADCTSDTLLWDSVDLITLGYHHIEGAIQNEDIKNFYGNFGTKPAWGPAVKSNTGYMDYVLTDNLMYVLKSTDGNAITYSIGVSGTNMISYFGWFTEDFEVQDHKAWDASDSTKGAIAEGSHIGLNILLNMQDSVTGNGIVDFLSTKVSDAGTDSTVSIIVSGHSLGGALAPLLALKLRENKSLSAANIQTYAFAGPTPGNVKFATYMVKTLGADNYHAHNNKLDLVPHVWEVDSIDK
ncbi:MAG: hypothetical protein AAF206_20855, partial [Bacteroidota bacterium]